MGRNLRERKKNFHNKQTNKRVSRVKMINRGMEQGSESQYLFWTVEETPSLLTAAAWWNTTENGIWVVNPVHVIDVENFCTLDFFSEAKVPGFEQSEFFCADFPDFTRSFVRWDKWEVVGMCKVKVVVTHTHEK